MSRIPAVGSWDGESFWFLQGGQHALCHGVSQREVGSGAFLKQVMACDEQEEEVCHW